MKFKKFSSLLTHLHSRFPESPYSLVYFCAQTEVLVGVGDGRTQNAREGHEVIRSTKDKVSRVRGAPAYLIPSLSLPERRWRSDRPQQTDRSPTSSEPTHSGCVNQNPHTPPVLLVLAARHPPQKGQHLEGHARPRAALPEVWRVEKRLLQVFLARFVLTGGLVSGAPTEV